jgi:proteasome lid subunit RPN8/RPN11
MSKATLPPARLPRAIYEEIIAHAREGKPEEICGILRGRGLEASELFRAHNIAADRIDNYDVDPQTLLLQFDFEDEGEEMMGIYHSHPISVAYPSATDAWNAHYPDSIYFICSLEKDDAPVLRAFRLTPHFVEFDIAHLRTQLPFHEVRPGLYGYFVPAGAAMPPLLAAPMPESAGPLYVVFYEDDRDTASPPEVRLVTIHEHPVEVV